MLASLEAMLDSILSLQREGEILKEKKVKVPTKKVIEKAAAKAADKKAADDAMTKASAGAADADKKSVEATNTDTVVGSEPEVKGAVAVAATVTVTVAERGEKKKEETKATEFFVFETAKEFDEARIALSEERWPSCMEADVRDKLRDLLGESKLYRITIYQED